MAPNGEGEVGAQNHEEEQRYHLKRQARNHEIDSYLLLRTHLGRRGDGPASGLQDQRKYITADEGDGVGGGAEAGDVSAIDDDNAGETNVNRAAEEGGSNS